MKKQLIIVGMIPVLIAVGFSGCTENNTANELGYQNTEFGFALNPPEGWTIQDVSNQYAVFVSFLGPTEDNFQINIYISNATLETGETIAGKAEELTDMYSSNENFSLIISDETTVNDMNAYEIVYTMNTLKQKMVLVEKNNKVLILVYSALETSYDKYLTVFEESLNSLVIE